MEPGVLDGMHKPVGFGDGISIHPGHCVPIVWRAGPSLAARHHRWVAVLLSVQHVHVAKKSSGYSNDHNVIITLLQMLYSIVTKCFAQALVWADGTPL